MRLENLGEVVRVSDIKELGASTADQFEKQVRGCIKASPDPKTIEVDLADTAFLDSCGVGALISLHKLAQAKKGKVRLLHPRPPIAQILELTRMHRLLEIVKKE